MPGSREDKRLRREVYMIYAKAAACAELGGELAARALCLGREALALWDRIAAPTAEDRLLRRELEALLAGLDAQSEKNRPETDKKP